MLYVIIESEVSQSCPHLCDPIDCSLCPWDFPGKSTGVGCHCLLQGIFPTWGLSLGLLNCRQTLYHLSHQRSPIVYVIIELVKFSLLVIIHWGRDVDYCDVELFALEMKWDHSVAFYVAPKYCISHSYCLWGLFHFFYGILAHSSRKNCPLN